MEIENDEKPTLLDEMRIIILFNHFQIQDGVARYAIGMANALVNRSDTEVVLRPLFRYDSSMCDCLDSRVEIKPVFKHYFRGFSKVIGKLPMTFLHNYIIGNDYDMEIGLCMSVPIRIVAAYSPQKKELEKMLNYGIGNSNAFMKKKNTHCYGNWNNHTVMRFAWMHGYDTGLSLRAEYEKIGKVVCVSKFNADRLRVDVGDAFDIDYAYNLLNDDEIRNKGEQPISVEPNKQMQFVSVGRMSPEKGYIRLIDICKQLENDGYKFNLWLVGDGPQREELEVHAKQIKADSCVTFLGQQSNPHAFTSKCDVFICSSFNEGYSTACTEAIMLGVPVITTDVSGGQEIIDEAECGLIVNKTNDDALYQALKKVLDKPETVSGWKRTLEATRERFSYKHRAKKLYKVLGLE